jgi:hypothetical protein
MLQFLLLHLHRRRSPLLILACLSSLSLGEYIAERGGEASACRVASTNDRISTTQARACLLEGTTDNVAVVREALAKDSGRATKRRETAGSGRLGRRRNAGARRFARARGAIRVGGVGSLELEQNTY